MLERKPQQKINMCQLHNTSPVSEKPFYTSTGWGVRQTKIQMYIVFIETQHKQYGHNIEWPPSSYRKFS